MTQRGLQSLCQEAIPPGSIQGPVRLVQNLKKQTVVHMGIVFSDLAPDGEKPIALPLGILHQGVIVVDVDHHSQIMAERLFDDPIHPGQDRGRERIGGLRRSIGRPPDGHTHAIKAGCSDALKVALLEHQAPIALAGCLERVPQVHAPPQERGAGGCTLGRPRG